MNLPYRPTARPAAGSIAPAARLLHIADAPELPVAVEALLRVLSRLQEQLRSLVGLAAGKLAALRRADADALLAGASREQELLQQVVADHGARDAEIARLAQLLRMESSPLPRLTALAARLPEPQASQILTKSAGLYGLAAELQEKNRHAAGVARHLHSHVSAVFAEVAKAGQAAVVYGPSGQHEQRIAKRWFDAVG